MRPPANRAMRGSSGDTRNEDAERAIKIKTECLKLTLQGLQKMLEGEKRKLEKERGEVEGLARRQGLVLVDPDVTALEQPGQPHPFEGMKETEKREDIEEKRKDKEKIDWRQGDCLTGSEEYLKYDGRDSTHNVSALTDSWRNEDADVYDLNGMDVWMKEKKAGNVERNFWSKREFNDPFTESIFKDVESLDGDGTLCSGSFSTDSRLWSRRHKSSYSEASEEMGYETSLASQDTSFSTPSNLHLASLISQVDHITKAIEELQNS